MDDTGFFYMIFAFLYLGAGVLSFLTAVVLQLQESNEQENNKDTKISIAIVLGFVCFAACGGFLAYTIQLLTQS